MSKYIPSLIGNTESLTSTIITDEYVGEVNLNTFLKNYKISNFFKGRYFFIRLIKKIFKYKLNERFIWKSDFWNNISIVTANSSISIYKKTYNEFELYLTKTCNKKRIKNIYNYKNLIEKGKDLSPPLYITGSCLNLLGAKTKADELFMLDGSRRLLSMLLAKKKVTKLLIIKLKDH